MSQHPKTSVHYFRVTYHMHVFAPAGTSRYVRGMQLATGLACPILHCMLPPLNAASYRAAAEGAPDSLLPVSDRAAPQSSDIKIGQNAGAPMRDHG